MTEADILYQLSIVTDRLWSMNQWWASISFGIIALAHFAAAKLNRLLLVCIILVYSAFSFWVYGLTKLNQTILGAFYSDLSLLYSTGITPSAAGVAISTGLSVSIEIAKAITHYGTFIGCISYLVYSYVQNKPKQ